jgi:hypothetical protein
MSGVEQAMEPLFEVYVSPAGREWMMSLSRDQGVLAAVLSDLVLRLQKVRELGPLYGADPGRPIRKLDGFENLWESRVRHRRTQYRQFFRFTTIAGRQAAVFIGGTQKRGAALPRHALETATRQLDDYIAELAVSQPQQDTDRAR